MTQEVRHFQKAQLTPRKQHHANRMVTFVGDGTLIAEEVSITR